MKTLKRCNDREEWDDYILSNGGHPLQLWGWGDVKALHGWKAYRLWLQGDEEGIEGAVQVLVRKLPWPLKSLAYVPRGPVVDGDSRGDLLDTLGVYVKNKFHSVVLSVEPDVVDFDQPTGKWRRSYNKILPSKTIILDLEKTEDELLSEMSKKTRQYIRKSGNEGLIIKPVRSKEGLSSCLDLYHETAKRAKFALHSDEYYIDIFHKLGDNSQIFAAYLEGEPVAFLWLAISTSTAYELYGGVNQTGQQIRANYALKWHSITKCKEWGLSRYDFGGMIEGGVSTFKKGWSERETELVGMYDLPLSITYVIWNNLLPIARRVVRLIKSIARR